MRMVGLTGVTSIVTRVRVTVSSVEPATLPVVAEMRAEPAATPVARPPPVIVALAVVFDAQVTSPEMSCWKLSS